MPRIGPPGPKALAAARIPSPAGYRIPRERFGVLTTRLEPPNRIVPLGVAKRCLRSQVLPGDPSDQLAFQISYLDYHSPRLARRLAARSSWVGAWNFRYTAGGMPQNRYVNPNPIEM